MEPDTSTLIVRQTYQSRARERIADLTIERVGAAGPPADLSPQTLDQALAAAAAYVRGTATIFTDWAEGFAQRKNELPRFDAKVAAAAHGDPNIVYYHGYWELAEGEQLWIEVTPPACDYWNFQVNNHWMESLDYRFHRIALNHSEAKLETDGSLRLVLAQRDPGHPNWLETAGHRRGTMCLRWIGARQHPDPRTRVVEAVAQHRDVEADAVRDGRDWICTDHARAVAVERELRAGHVRDHHVEGRLHAIGDLRARDHACRTRSDRRRRELREVLEHVGRHRVVLLLRGLHRLVRPAGAARSGSRRASAARPPWPRRGSPAFPFCSSVRTDTGTMASSGAFGSSWRSAR